MCEPVTIMTGLSLAMAGVGVYSQNETAKAQADAIRVQQESERKETLQRNEEELGQRVRASREARARARARVAAGESGAMGASFAASMNQSLQDQDNDAALIQKNVAFSNRATDDRANTAFAGIRKPSALEAGLTIAGAGVAGYDAGKRLTEDAK